MSPPRDESVVVASQQPKSSKEESRSQDEKSVIQASGSLDQVECSMCGDVGLPQELFRCSKCHFRLQHTYCSHSYPKKRSYAGICNWCDKNDGLVHVARTTKPLKSAPETESAKPRIWNNELEMLLEAAAVALENEREFKRPSNSSGSESRCRINAGCPVNKRPRKMLRAKSNPDKTEDANAKTEENGVYKCKHTKMEPSTLSKRMGRRYKCILDVY